MKKKYIFIVFLLFFFTGILPPLFVSGGAPFSHVESSLSTCITIFGQLSGALVLHCFCSRFVLPRPRPRRHFFVLLSCATVSFGLLMLISAAIESLCFFFPRFFVSQHFVLRPSGFLSCFFFVLSLITGATYEEVVYREFLPETALFCAKAMSPRQWLHSSVDLCVELCSVLIFAFSHRYLGLPAVINAALSGIVLRRCFCKTGTVLSGCIIHFLYNLLLVIFLLLSKLSPA